LLSQQRITPAKIDEGAERRKEDGKKRVPELLISHANPQAGGLSFEMKLLL